MTNLVGQDEVPRRFGLTTATLLVMANMIGTGIFTSTGLLVGELGSARTVLWVWILGGIVALFGALSYGELGARIPRNGGEYRFLTAAFHPAIGFIGGFVSIVVGFAAPIAGSALAFGRYLHAVWPSLAPLPLAAGLLVLLSSIHALRVNAGGSLQNALATVKLSLLVGFVLVGSYLLWRNPTAQPASLPAPLPLSLSKLALGFVFVSFSYSGYNAAAYLAGEIRAPAANLPRALTLGTLLTTLLYLGVNAVTLSSVAPAKLRGIIEVGHVAAAQLIGPRVADAFSITVAGALASSASAMILMGARVYEAMGCDYPALKVFTRRTAHGGPHWAFALQTTLVLTMLVSMSFDLLLSYVGITLSLSAALTVLGLLLLRCRERGKKVRFRASAQLAAPYLFLGLTVLMITCAIVERPLAALLGSATLAVGALLYMLVNRKGHTQ